MSRAKTMNRSRNQLATAYAPGSFFTFEGGMGACLAQSSEGDEVGLSASTTDLIFERMEEIGRAWIDAALNARSATPDKPQIVPAQCVDRGLLDHRSAFQLPGRAQIHLCAPSRMAYTPAPLAFVCRNCHVFRDFQSLNQMVGALGDMRSSLCDDGDGTSPCDWEQLDIVFVHWSGHWLAPFPGSFDWDNEGARLVLRRGPCTCGCMVYRLDRRAPAIGDWFFYCARCRTRRSWRQNDPDTIEILGAAFPQRVKDARMEPTPYRASNAYYVKSDLFIDFKADDHRFLDVLPVGRESLLENFVAERYGFKVTALTDEEVREACHGREACQELLSSFDTQVTSIEAAEAMMLENGPSKMLQSFLDGARMARQAVVQKLLDDRLISAVAALPEGVLQNLRHRRSHFASKFDPFRLGVEHAALKASRLDIGQHARNKHSFVSFTRLDADLSPETAAEAEAQEAITTKLLDGLGLADMGLIREFDLCKFSFGYSRMEAGPVLHDKHREEMPVRLRLFDQVRINGRQKWPVYVVQQGNEAIYVRLKEDQVLAWLRTLDCSDMFELEGNETVGAGLLKVAQPMGPFLDRLGQSDSPSCYHYAYALLHSYSHLLMKHVAEFSGLDLGSLGEYIFPADLAFVVYRNGTTMDLGNLSAMWRNAGNAMLSSMLAPKAAQCGTGTLCTHRGGACPDCLMVPETSCVASNKLLSRSVLRSVGGRPSRFDTRANPIEGYTAFSQPIA